MEHFSPKSPWQATRGHPITLSTPPEYFPQIRQWCNIPTTRRRADAIKELL